MAEVVTSEKVEGLAAAVERLEQAQYRKRLGLASREVGSRLFSYRTSVEALLRTLEHSPQSAERTTEQEDLRVLRDLRGENPGALSWFGWNHGTWEHL